MILDALKRIFRKEKFAGMKYLIVGLGNMGDEYTNTRHNIGFNAVDAFVNAHDEKFKTAHWAHIAQIALPEKKVCVIKPTTYMNLSGKAVRHWMQYYEVPQENVLVVVDDLAIDFDTQRLRISGSAGGHNGLKSIDESLGNNIYARLRIGIGDNFKKGKQVNFVLGKWTNKENEILPDIIDTARKTIEAFINEGINVAMNKYNTKK